MDTVCLGVHFIGTILAIIIYGIEFSIIGYFIGSIAFKNGIYYDICKVDEIHMPGYNPDLAAGQA